MATEGKDIRDVLADSDKLIKSGERDLKKIEKIREEIGLNAGASKEFLEHIPENDAKNQKAQKKLRQFMDKMIEPGQEKPEADSPEKGKKKKKRSKLANAMNKRLRI